MNNDSNATLLHVNTDPSIEFQLISIFPNLHLGGTTWCHSTGCHLKMTNDRCILKKYQDDPGWFKAINYSTFGYSIGLVLQQGFHLVSTMSKLPSSSSHPRWLHLVTPPPLIWWFTCPLDGLNACCALDSPGFVDVPVDDAPRLLLDVLFSRDPWLIPWLIPRSHGLILGRFRGVHHRTIHAPQGARRIAAVDAQRGHEGAMDPRHALWCGASSDHQLLSWHIGDMWCQ